MDMRRGDIAFEQLNRSLDDEAALNAYKARHDDYRPAFFPRILGRFLVVCGNMLYGWEPSYLKFRSVEIIARVPYHSWVSSTYTLLTLFYADEARAIALSHTSIFAKHAQDNETMHVVVVSQLAKSEIRAGFVRQTIIPLLFANFYFWASFFLHLFHPRYAYELNYLFERHAFEQYDRFLKVHGEALRKKPVESAFLTWYGRTPKDQYEFFRSVRNDEIIHRNTSIEHIARAR